MRKVDVEQGSHEWHCLRHGMVTGTTLKSALGSEKVQETLLYKLVAERMTEPVIDEINVKSIERGREIEPIARKAIIQTTGLDFIETGMLVSDDIPGFGLSPDAVYEYGGKVVGGLEIKCPDSKKHIEYIFGKTVPKDYHHQVKAPFILSDDIEWWVFASFDDRNYELPLFMHTVNRSEFPDIAEERENLKAFLARVDNKHLELTF